MKITKKLLIIIFFMGIVTLLFSYNSTSVKDSKVTNVIQVKQDMKTLDYNQMLVSFLPLEIGEATLIQLANNDFYLIDTGYTDRAEELISFLEQHGVQKLKGVFLTNNCKEHIGGLPFLLERYPIENIYLPELTANTFKIQRNQYVGIKRLKANDEITLQSDVRMKVLAPLEPLSLSPQANSLVLQLNHKDIRYLFTSEINANIEQRLIEKYDLNSEILKVSDYGNNNGSIPDFLKEVDAQVGIIFSSDPSLYKLSDDVIERLNESWIDVYMVKRYGEVQILSDGENYDVETIEN